VALTVGATHTLSGTGQVAIATPIGLSIATAGIPSWVARAPGTPTTYHGLGKLSVGHALGWQAPVDLELVPQLVYPLPTEYTLLGYTFLAGLTVTVGELVAPAPLNSSLQPWDRAPAAWTAGAAAGFSGGTTTTTMWTYTVPAGRKLWLARATARLWHYIVPTTAGVALVQVLLNSAQMLYAECRNGVLGEQHSDDLQGGPLILPAGSVLSASVTNTDSGGGVIASADASGFLFDA
jgi:hypothetical protein